MFKTRFEPGKQELTLTPHAGQHTIKQLETELLSLHQPASAEELQGQDSSNTQPEEENKRTDSEGRREVGVWPPEATTFKSTGRDSSSARWTQFPPESQSKGQQWGTFFVVVSKIGRQCCSCLFSTVNQDILDIVLVFHFFHLAASSHQAGRSHRTQLPPARTHGGRLSSGTLRDGGSAAQCTVAHYRWRGAQPPQQTPRSFSQRPTASEQSKSAYANVN